MKNIISKSFKVTKSELFLNLKSGKFAMLSAEDQKRSFAQFQQMVYSLSANAEDYIHLYRDLNCAITEIEIIAQQKKRS